MTMTGEEWNYRKNTAIIMIVMGLFVGFLNIQFVFDTAIAEWSRFFLAVISAIGFGMFLVGICYFEKLRRMIQ